MVSAINLASSCDQREDKGERIIELLHDGVEPTSTWATNGHVAPAHSSNNTQEPVCTDEQLIDSLLEM
jgi:hypothetical protein